MTPYIGAIFSFGFNYATYGWNLCNGATLSINDYTALYSLIGTTYGGDGVTTFKVPNLQGRVPIGYGQGPGLQNYILGQAAGSETVTLTSSNLPPHTHAALSAGLPVSGSNGELNDPTNAYFGVSNVAIAETYDNQVGSPMGANPVSQSGITGSSFPFEVMNNYQVVSYCIAVEGIFPPRS